MPTATRTRNMGGSLLPSEDGRTRTPQTFEGHTLQVVAIEEMDSYFLTLTPAGTTEPLFLAGHPNGHSCRLLADDLIKHWTAPTADTVRRVTGNWEAILSCGGMARSPTTLAWLLRKMERAD